MEVVYRGVTNGLQTNADRERVASMLDNVSDLGDGYLDIGSSDTVKFYTLGYATFVPRAIVHVLAARGYKEQLKDCN